MKRIKPGRKMAVLVMIIAAVLLTVEETNAEPIRMHLTCYCPESCPGTITYTGAHVREGIAAVTTEHIGDKALIWTVSGDYLGCWECLDRIGTGNRSVIDVWKPDIESAREMMRLTGGRVMVSFVREPE